MRRLEMILSRLAWFVPTLAGLVVIVFLISNVIPTDPVRVLLGENATPAHGYDQPLWVQLARHFRDILSGNLGISIYSQRPISEDLAQRLPATLELTLVAITLSIAVGIPLGVMSALKRNSLLDHMVRVISVSGLAIAAFWLAMLLQFLFSMKLGVAPLNSRIDGFGPPPVTGFMTVDSLLDWDMESLRSAFSHITLPALTLALPAAATIVRFTRAGVLDVINSNHVLYQRAMGMPPGLIVWKYVLRNALISTVTQIGLIFGVLVTNAVIVETVFDWPGIGTFAVQSILQSDHKAIIGFTIWIGAPIRSSTRGEHDEGARMMPGWRRELGRLARDRAAALGMALLLLLIVAAIFAPILAPFPGDVADFHTANRLHSPDAANWLGTDRMGSDLLSRIVFGARITITIAFVAVGSAVVLGVPIGLVAGYYGGWPSNLLMRVSDIFLAVPQIVLAIAIAQTLGPSIENVILALSITYWPFWARLVFAETRSLKNEVFIESAIALGASPLRVMTLHVLPNIASAIIVRTSIGMGATILTAAALGFLGLGAPPPTPEWGRMIAESREFLPEAWWYATAPGIAIVMVVMGFNLLGDGLRDFLDPRIRRGAGGK